MSKVTNISKAQLGFSYELAERGESGGYPYRILNPDGTECCAGTYTSNHGKPPTEKDADAWLLRTVKRINDDNGYKTGRHSRKTRVVDGKTIPTIAHNWKRALKEA